MPKATNVSFELVGSVELRTQDVGGQPSTCHEFTTKHGPPGLPRPGVDADNFGHRDRVQHAVVRVLWHAPRAVLVSRVGPGGPVLALLRLLSDLLEQLAVLLSAVSAADAVHGAAEAGGVAAATAAEAGVASAADQQDPGVEAAGDEPCRVLRSRRQRRPRTAAFTIRMPIV